MLIAQLKSNGHGSTTHIVNLDPAAEELCYTPTIDIRDLISLDDVTVRETDLNWRLNTS